MNGNKGANGRNTSCPIGGDHMAEIFVGFQPLSTKDINPEDSNAIVNRNRKYFNT
jgi:hypothetical protein